MLVAVDRRRRRELTSFDIRRGLAVAHETGVDADRRHRSDRVPPPARAAAKAGRPRDGDGRAHARRRCRRLRQLARQAGEAHVVVHHASFAGLGGGRAGGDAWSLGASAAARRCGRRRRRTVAGPLAVGSAGATRPEPRRRHLRRRCSPLARVARARRRRAPPPGDPRSSLPTAPPRSAAPMADDSPKPAGCPRRPRRPPPPLAACDGRWPARGRRATLTPPCRLAPRAPAGVARVPWRRRPSRDRRDLRIRGLTPRSGRDGAALSFFVGADGDGGERRGGQAICAGGSVETEVRWRELGRRSVARLLLRRRSTASARRRGWRRRADMLAATSARRPAVDLLADEASDHVPAHVADGDGQTRHVHLADGDVAVARRCRTATHRAAAFDDHAQRSGERRRRIPRRAYLVRGPRCR